MSREPFRLWIRKVAASSLVTLDTLFGYPRHVTALWNTTEDWVTKTRKVTTTWRNYAILVILGPFLNFGFWNHDNLALEKCF